MVQPPAWSAGHHLHLEQPAVVIDAIQRIVEAARQREAPPRD